MQIIALSEEIEGWDFPEGATWCVYDYASGSYEGSGTAYCGDGHNKFWSRNLGHCSCYGPIDQSSWDMLGLSDLRMHLTGDTTGIAAKIQEMGFAELRKFFPN